MESMVGSVAGLKCTSRKKEKNHKTWSMKLYQLRKKNNEVNEQGDKDLCDMIKFNKIV